MKKTKSEKLAILERYYTIRGFVFCLAFFGHCGHFSGGPKDMISKSHFVELGHQNCDKKRWVGGGPFFRQCVVTPVQMVTLMRMLVGVAGAVDPQLELGAAHQRWMMGLGSAGQTITLGPCWSHIRLTIISSSSGRMVRLIISSSSGFVLLS